MPEGGSVIVRNFKSKGAYDAAQLSGKCSKIRKRDYSKFRILIAGDRSGAIKKHGGRFSPDHMFHINIEVVIKSQVLKDLDFFIIVVLIKGDR